MLAHDHLVGTVAAQLLGCALDALAAQQEAAQVHAQLVRQVTALGNQLEIRGHQLSFALLAEHPYILAFEHHANALLGRREALEDVRRRALQADGRRVDQGMILQLLIVVGCKRLAVGLVDAADAHVAGLVELLDAGDQARSLHLDGHVAVFQHALDRDGVAVLLDVGGIGHLGQVQLLGDLGTNLGRVAVDSLTAAHHDVVLVHTDGGDGSSQDLGGRVRIGAAELAGRHQHTLVRTHGHQLTQHAGCRRGTHSDDDDLAARGVLELQGGLHGVHVVRIGDRLHGRTVQSAVRIHRHLAGGIGNLLDTNNDLHVVSSSSYRPMLAEMTMRWTSEVPS